jgi:thymidylate synthase ThyX
MKVIRYGRKTFSFAEGAATLVHTSITEQSLPGENEEAFIQRLLESYGHRQGTIEVVFKNGRPSHAVLNFD